MRADSDYENIEIWCSSLVFAADEVLKSPRDDEYPHELQQVG